MPNAMIFLSYAREDSTAAARLCSDLRSADRNVWFDRDCLRGGENWRDAIYTAIGGSDFFLALLSGASVSKRGMVQSEMRKALQVLDEMPEGKVYLIPVRLTDCHPTYRRLQELHWIDLFPRWEDGIAQVLRSTVPDAGSTDPSDSWTPFDGLLESMLPIADAADAAVEVRVSETVREAIDMFREYALLRNIAIRYDDASPNALVRADRRDLLMVIANLLSNAIKYSYASPGQSSWVNVMSEARGTAVLLRFENWGLGIPEEELRSGRIYERGYRGRSALEHARTGTGIGLAAAKAVCEKYNGTIRIQSRPARSYAGGGAKEPHVTAVDVTLPMEK